MNPFRGRRKAKDDLAAPRPSLESEPSGPFKMFGKKKAIEEEPKKELDLTTALPSSDEFRTSLLMTGLSARFSMLREQDDPNTKVGKASDDSVLYPKRQSRMMDFGFGGGLSDIAEVESIKGPGFPRANSFISSDDAASTSGSIMNRAKPTEGNNLFGGRQKIYKIPAGGSSKNGGLPGRALYEDDVAQSAFQKWRQAEKDRRSFEDDNKDDSLDSDMAQPESPSHTGYNRRRETSSTTSSAPSVARNSTAATSITSTQPATSVKDWQNSTFSSSTTSPAPVERNVTRTRRLYEQSLHQDLQDQQSSALSRIDTLSKQRAFGTRTPDLTPVVPSPTTATFSDRFGNRSILSKASAPNLRSITPSTTGSAQISPIESSSKFPSTVEQRTSFGASPPLSPPISETEDQAALPIAPNDRGKATALGVFNKPSAQYDESRYAQRQIQLQQGRETPTNLFRTDSNISEPTSRSRSSSSHRTPFENRESATLKPQPPVQAAAQRSTFFDDDDDDDQSADDEPSRLELPPQVTLKRPDDDDHPAFRKSALPTPLTLSFKPFDSPAPIVEKPEISSTNSKNASPEDSPTLGPTSGLSGMVRQHLRNDSNTSSVYGSVTNDRDLASRFPSEREDVVPQQQPVEKTKSWELNVGDWARGVENRSSFSNTKTETGPQGIARDPSPSTRDSRSDIDDEKETDEFARHLADGARRVRERLTSYVESDPGGSTSPAIPATELLPPPSRSNPLGILKSKSSRGSLIDRGRGDKEGLSQLKAKKLLGLGTPPVPVSPSARQTSFEMNDDPRREDENGQSGEQDGASGDKENVHAGLKAFRQARRELQRMKELEVQQRYQAPQKAPPVQEQAPVARPGPQASPNPPGQDRRPPIAYNNRIPSEESRNGQRSRSASRAPSERDRSGSETSSGGRSGSRPPRMRNGSVPYEEHHGPGSHPYGPNGMPRQGPMMRLAGHAGQDMKRPHMPPQAYSAGNISPGRFKRSESAQNLSAQPYGGHDSGQPSPISLHGAPSPYGPPGMPSPRVHGPTQPASLDPRHPANRVMGNRDFSEPSFASPTGQGMLGARSRSGSLLQAAASTPNLHSGLSAPPVPPINPRRKNNMMGGYLRRSEDEMTLSSPHLPLSPGRGDEGQMPLSPRDSDDVNGQYRQKLRKATSEAHGMNIRARSMRNSPPQPMNRPPMPPTLGNSTMPGGMI